MPGIYMIRCIATGEIYIGATKSKFERRFANHKTALKCGRGGRELQKRYDAHGPESFEYVALQEFDVSELFDREQEAIAKLQPRMNKNVIARDVYDAMQETGLTREAIEYRKAKGQDLVYGSATHAEYKGKMMRLAEISDATGLDVGTLNARYKRGDRGAALVRPLNVKI